jgi:predicted nucleic acid-binding protein
VVARLSPDLCGPALRLLNALELDICADLDVFERGAALAVALDYHLFDTLYHAVALERDATLITADARYARKARAQGQILLLSEPLDALGLR